MSARPPPSGPVGETHHISTVTPFLELKGMSSRIKYLRSSLNLTSTFSKQNTANTECWVNAHLKPTLWCRKILNMLFLYEEEVLPCCNLQDKNSKGSSLTWMMAICAVTVMSPMVLSLQVVKATRLGSCSNETHSYLGPWVHQGPLGIFPVAHVLSLRMERKWKDEYIL